MIDTDSLLALSRSSHEAAEQLVQVNRDLLAQWGRTAQVRPELVRTAADGARVGVALLALAAGCERRRAGLLLDVALAEAADAGVIVGLTAYAAWSEAHEEAGHVGTGLGEGWEHLRDTPWADPLGVLAAPWLLPGRSAMVATSSWLAARSEVPARDPAEVAAWWASLSTAERRTLLERSPGRLGNLDGLPAGVRNAANTARLATERSALTAERSRLQAAREQGRDDPATRARLSQVEGKLAALEELRIGLSYGDRQLLVLDTSGRRVKAALAVGDVDTADHVAVFTPGFTSTVEDSLLRYDRDTAALRTQAQQLASRAGTGTVATVTWLDYEAPQVDEIGDPLRSVATDHAARQGAVRLERFLDGVDASRPEPPHLTLLGHSYGSLTSGLALQRGTGVDDVVVFGSPGLGTSRVADLQVDPGRVYVVEARNDPVADLAAFGGDPNQMHGVTGLSARAGEHGAESVEHSEYLHQDTTSQYGISAVVAGQGELAPRDDGRGHGDLLRAPLLGGPR